MTSRRPCRAVLTVTAPTREAAGIVTANWRYDHAAIIGAFHHERSHEDTAYEIFYPAGPFALLPLVDDDDGHRCAIVWSVVHMKRAVCCVSEMRTPRQSTPCASSHWR